MAGASGVSGYKKKPLPTGTVLLMRSADPMKGDGESSTFPSILGYVATERHVRLVFRPEHDEWDLIEQHPELFDAVLVPESYVAPYPPEHLFASSTPTRLLDVSRAADIPVWRDPETSGLSSRSVLRLSATRRLRLTPLARAFPLPLDLTAFDRPKARMHAVELVLAAQSGSETAAAPYFNFDRRDSQAFRLNLRLARDVVSSVADQIPTAFVQVTQRKLLTGLPAAVAADYAAVGVRRVVIRVRGLKCQQANAQELAAYLDSIEAFQSNGVDAFADCAGLLGPVLVAGGAAGFSTGTRFFKSVPAAPLSVGGGGGGSPIAAQVPGTFSEVSRPSDQSARDTRVANLKNLRALTQLAARDPDALIASLRMDRGIYSAVWASVLAGRRRRAV